MIVYYFPSSSPEKSQKRKLEKEPPQNFVGDTDVVAISDDETHNLVEKDFEDIAKRESRKY